MMTKNSPALLGGNEGNILEPYLAFRRAASISPYLILNAFQMGDEELSSASLNAEKEPFSSREEASIAGGLTWTSLGDDDGTQLTF